jgi:thiol-disulfide isomerase/thioredoxin
MRAVYVVYADWCPHCVPTTVGPVERAAKELGVPAVLYDIDTDDVGKADELVKKYGDWTPDYVIPQVFVEMDDGKIEHVLTGDRRGVQYTRQAVETLLKSRLSKQQVSR